jgi:hypothetical protein
MQACNVQHSTCHEQHRLHVKTLHAQQCTLHVTRCTLACRMLSVARCTLHVASCTAVRCAHSWHRCVALQLIRLLASSRVQVQPTAASAIICALPRRGSPLLQCRTHRCRFGSCLFAALPSQLNRGAHRGLLLCRKCARPYRRVLFRRCYCSFRCRSAQRSAACSSRCSARSCTVRTGNAQLSESGFARMGLRVQRGLPPRCRAG